MPHMKPMNWLLLMLMFLLLLIVLLSMFYFAYRYYKKEKIWSKCSKEFKAKWKK